MRAFPSIGQTIIDFPPFQLDLRAGMLRRESVSVPLRPKTFAVLQHLAERPGELLTKRALLDAVWGEVAVSEDVVRLSVGELRAALGDARRAPRFIETVPRRGYRFIARMGLETNVTVADPTQASIEERPEVDAHVVGRQRERLLLAEWLEVASRGRRQIAFIAGEPGIGKTTLIDVAMNDLLHGNGPPFRIGRGQCIEHYGGGEPYLPVVEAIENLRNGPDRNNVDSCLRDHAPGWLLRVMGIDRPARVESGGPPPSTHEHTLHRLAASIEALATDIPLVLVLEDVQWSDYSTLDLLSVLAHRREPTRLLILCTLRPADAIVRGHPVADLKRELQRKRLSREILLDGLSPANIASYLEVRFGGAALPPDLLPLLAHRSEGNPFFVVTLVDHLLELQLLAESAGGWRLHGGLEVLRTMVPDGLHAVIEPRLERLDPQELRVLEAASAAGAEFGSHVLASCAPSERGVADVEHVERVCDALVRRQEILRAAAEKTWPDGSVSSCYAFRHALYQQVVYGRLSPSTRRRLHQSIGEALENVCGAETASVAAELAEHFERSRDADRAVRYHTEAADHAGSRLAYEESRFHLERALVALDSRPDSPEVLQREMELLERLGWTLFALRGFGDDGAARAFTRFRDLADRLDAPESRLRATQSLLTVHTMRAEHATARKLGEETIAIAEHAGDQPALAVARATLGAALMHLGQLEAAHQQAELGLAESDPDRPSIGSVSTYLLLASTCAHLGLATRAREMNHQAVAAAERLRIPYIRAHATIFAATIYQVLRDVPETRFFAEETLRLSIDGGFSVFRIMATMYVGWCEVQDGLLKEGLDKTRQAFQQYEKSGQRISTTSYALLVAEAHLANRDVVAAVDTINTASAFAAETGEQLYEHELRRLRGECLLASPAIEDNETEAIQCFEQALAIAAGRGSLLFELRAATSLYRVRKSARPRLATLVGRFGPEGDCADLRAALTLLETGATVTRGKRR